MSGCGGKIGWIAGWQHVRNQPRHQGTAPWIHPCWKGREQGVEWGMVIQEHTLIPSCCWQRWHLTVAGECKTIHLFIHTVPSCAVLGEEAAPQKERPHRERSIWIFPLELCPSWSSYVRVGTSWSSLTGCWWQRHTQGSTTLGMGGQGTHPARGEHLDLSTFPVHRNLGCVVMCWGFLMPSPPGAGMLVQFQVLSQLVAFILRSA